MTQTYDVARIASDPDDLEAFYRAHVMVVQTFIARRVSDPHLAADLTAEVFLAAIDSAPKYRPHKGNPTGWLYGIARNVVAAEHRRHARQTRVDRRISGRALAEADDIAVIGDRIDAKAQSRELYEAMDRLSDKERGVLELVALDGLTVTEAAQALGIRSSAARVRLHRARKLLRDHIAQSTQSPINVPSEVLA